MYRNCGPIFTRMYSGSLISISRILQRSVNFFIPTGFIPSPTRWIFDPISHKIWPPNYFSFLHHGCYCPRKNSTDGCRCSGKERDQLLYWTKSPTSLVSSNFTPTSPVYSESICTKMFYRKPVLSFIIPWPVPIWSNSSLLSQVWAFTVSCASTPSPHL